MDEAEEDEKEDEGRLEEEEDDNDIFPLESGVFVTVLVLITDDGRAKYACILYTVEILKI